MDMKKVREMLGGCGWPDDIGDVGKYPVSIDATGKPSGWCVGEMRTLMRSLCSGSFVVIDGGSFLGRSASEWCENTMAGVIICIDHWQGSEEHQGREDVGRLWETYCGNMRELGLLNRVLPVRMDSVCGMRHVAKAGVVADAILIDWSHDRVSAASDIGCAMALWPGAKLLVDDYRHKGVRAAVDEAMERVSRKYELVECEKVCAIVPRNVGAVKANPKAMVKITEG